MGMISLWPAAARHPSGRPDPRQTTGPGIRDGCCKACDRVALHFSDCRHPDAFEDNFCKYV